MAVLPSARACSWSETHSPTRKRKSACALPDKGSEATLETMSESSVVRRNTSLKDSRSPDGVVYAALASAICLHHSCMSFARSDAVPAVFQEASSLETVSATLAVDASLDCLGAEKTAPLWASPFAAAWALCPAGAGGAAEEGSALVASAEAAAFFFRLRFFFLLVEVDQPSPLLSLRRSKALEVKDAMVAAVAKLSRRPRRSARLYRGWRVGRRGRARSTEPSSRPGQASAPDGARRHANERRGGARPAGRRRGGRAGSAAAAASVRPSVRPSILGPRRVASRRVALRSGTRPGGRAPGPTRAWTDGVVVVVVLVMVMAMAMVIIITKGQRWMARGFAGGEGAACLARLGSKIRLGSARLDSIHVQVRVHAQTVLVVPGRGRSRRVRRWDVSIGDRSQIGGVSDL
eukprot:scaffold4744_cov426-Prasinococcus_capsulatus_cf.AAC.13